MTTNKRGGQVKQLEDKLNSNDQELKLEAIRRIIDAMTRGKDVSMLFMSVMKNMESPNLQLKKLIYLYMINYARSHPDLAILGTNSFRKDAKDKGNPFLRALAVRTMGCIRIKQIAEYLCDPLKLALRDEDSYVRKTAVLCVPKLFDIHPELIQNEGFIKLLENLLNDGNAMVVSNTVAALMICGQSKGEQFLKLTNQMVQKLLTAMNDCYEWGVVYILDALNTYVPADAHQTESIMERISSRLAHKNAAVALSSIKLIMKYMDYLTDPELIRNYSAKISAPLITLLAIDREPEISFITLRCINLILQKRSIVIPKDIKIFYVNYHDPPYIKLEKLEILAKLANNDNVELILTQLKEYTQEVDVEFVRRSIRVMGRCAIKLEKKAEKCVYELWEALKTKVNYVVQQAIIVIRDVFRKYPNKYEGILKDICQNLKSLDDPDAKASIVWIIGEYVELIENADELLANFAENFRDEADVVQQQILISCIKLFLLRPAEGQTIARDLLKKITSQCQNPDLRDRAFIYWRLIATNPELAKKIVFSERPLISDQSYTIETDLLDKLIDNIGTLSAVYYKEPEDFVKKLKDTANAKEIIEYEGYDFIENKKGENVEFFVDQPQTISFKQNQQQVPPYNTQQLQPQTQPVPVPTNNEPIDILGIDEPSISTVNQSTRHFNTTAPQNSESIDIMGMEETKVSHQTVPGGIDIMSNFSNSEEQTNIVIPKLQVLTESDTGLNNKAQGLNIKAAFQRVGEKMYLEMAFENKSNISFSELAVKFNSNAFNLSPVNITLDIEQLNPGQSQQTKILLNTSNQSADLKDYPFLVQVALRTNIDMFLFTIPCSLSVLMLPGMTVEIEKYKELLANPSNFKIQEQLTNKLDLQSFVKKFSNNNLSLVYRKNEGAKELMSFICCLVNKTYAMVDVIFEKSTNNVMLQISSQQSGLLPLVKYALAMIVNL